MSRRPPEFLVRSLALCACAVSLVATAYVVAGIVDTLARHQQMAPWILARASGFTSYGLMLVLVCSGLVLSHPAGSRLRRPSHHTRLRLHVSLAIFTLAFTVLHVVVLATDSFAAVGWKGSLVPMASQYRPVGVTLGVIAAYAALVTALTASLAGRVAGRIWWPIHKVSIVIFVLVWQHGFWTGIDTPSATWFYLATGALVLLLAMSRYLAKTPADRVEELLAGQRESMTPDDLVDRHRQQGGRGDRPPSLSGEAIEL